MSEKNQKLLMAGLRLSLRLTFKALVRPPLPVKWQRNIVSVLAGIGRLAPQVAVEQYSVGEITVERVTPKNVSKGKVILYFHGGAYCLGSAKTHRSLSSHLASSSNVQMVLPNYRLAPEHPFPAAQDDGLLCYRALLAEGYSPSDIIVGGDSAGGGLALSLLVRLQREDMPFPAGLVLLSPFVDLTLSGRSLVERRKREPMLAQSWITQGVAMYAADKAITDSACSPLFANFEGFPPMNIQVGSEEVLFDDAGRLAKKALESGVEVFLEEFDGCWHVFQLQAGTLSVADRAVESLAKFIRQKLNMEPNPK